jgi:hypothetical protein
MPGVCTHWQGQAQRPDAFKVDPRRNLYLTYLNWVRKLRPLAIVIENVLDILNKDGHNVAAEIVALLERENFDAMKRGARRPSATTVLPYRHEQPHSEYAREMREWPGFETGEGVADHFIRYLPRDGRVFEAMPEGMQYPGALKIAEQHFAKRAGELRRLRKNSAKWRELRKAMVPPYNPETFPNRWWKLIRDEPSRTLMAHLLAHPL